MIYYLYAMPHPATRAKRNLKQNETAMFQLKPKLQTPCIEVTIGNRRLVMTYANYRLLSLCGNSDAMLDAHDYNVLLKNNAATQHGLLSLKPVMRQTNDDFDRNAAYMFLGMTMGFNASPSVEMPVRNIMESISAVCLDNEKKLHPRMRHIAQTSTHALLAKIWLPHNKPKSDFIQANHDAFYTLTGIRLRGFVLVVPKSSAFYTEHAAEIDALTEFDFVRDQDGYDDGNAIPQWSFIGGDR